MEWLDPLSKFIGNVGFPIAFILLIVWGFIRMAPELTRMVTVHIEFIRALEKNMLLMQETLRRLESNEAARQKSEESREEHFLSILEHLQKGGSTRKDE